jgi:hypothetical protein
MNFSKEQKILFLLIVLVIIYFTQSKKVERFGIPSYFVKAGNKYVNLVNNYPVTQDYTILKTGTNYTTPVMANTYNTRGDELLTRASSPSRFYVSIVVDSNNNEVAKFNQYPLTTPDVYTNSGVKYYKLRKSSSNSLSSPFYIYFNLDDANKTEYRIKIDGQGNLGIVKGSFTNNFANFTLSGS